MKKKKKRNFFFVSFLGEKKEEKKIKFNSPSICPKHSLQIVLNFYFVAEQQTYLTKERKKRIRRRQSSWVNQ